MSGKKTYAVLGLGRYGRAVAKELVRSGAEVLAVDIDEDIVNNAIEDIPYCKCADVTDEDVLRQLGIGSIDVVIIAIAENLEASVMATMLCKEAGVKHVVVKCANPLHQRMLLKIGADEVTFPEHESGVRLAKNLLSSGFIDMISLSKDTSIVASMAVLIGSAYPIIPTTAPKVIPADAPTIIPFFQPNTKIIIII